MNCFMPSPLPCFLTAIVSCTAQCKMLLFSVKTVTVVMESDSFELAHLKTEEEEEEEKEEEKRFWRCGTFNFWCTCGTFTMATLGILKDIDICIACLYSTEL